MKNKYYLKSNRVVSQRIKSLMTSDSSVYMQYFGLKEKPFKCSQNPEYVYLSAVHNEALSLIIYAISSGEGFTALTGDAGTGKTTLIHILFKTIDKHYSAACILNPQMDSIDLLKTINFQFGLHSDSNDKFKLMKELNRFLIRKKAENKKAFLIIDEAQGLTETVLEQLRLLSNLQTRESKLLHIILVGTPDLVQKINSRTAHNLNQRIGVQIRLKPMSARDTRNYIHHRLQAAAAENRIKFTNTACRYIYRKTRGTARMINRLCDVSLMGAYSEQRTKITAFMVARAGREIIRQRCNGTKTPGILSNRRALGTALIYLTISVTILGVVYISGLYIQSQPSSAVLTSLAAATSGAESSTPARQAQAVESGEQPAEAYKVPTAVPAQESPNTAATITEPSDTQINREMPNLDNVQVLPDARQAETFEEAGRMASGNTASDTSPYQGFPVDADAAEGTADSQHLKGKNISDLIRTIIRQTPTDGPMADRKLKRPATATHSEPDDFLKRPERLNSSPQKKNRQPGNVSAASQKKILSHFRPRLHSKPIKKSRSFVPADFEALLAKVDIKSNRWNALAAVMGLLNIKLARESGVDRLKNDLFFFQQVAAANDLSIDAMLCDLKTLERVKQPCILELFVPSLQASRYVVLKALRDQRAVIDAGEKIGNTLITLNQLAPYWTGAVYILQKKTKDSSNEPDSQSHAPL